MPCDSERSESSKVSSVTQRDQTERYNDKENSLFMNMPSEEKGCIAAKSNCANKGIPGGFYKKSDEKRLCRLSLVQMT
jgi:hypothetical protein